MGQVYPWIIDTDAVLESDWNGIIVRAASEAPFVVTIPAPVRNGAKYIVKRLDNIKTPIILQASGTRIQLRDSLMIAPNTTITLTSRYYMWFLS
jgi:hypothetical protein